VYRLESRDVFQSNTIVNNLESRDGGFQNFQLSWLVICCRLSKKCIVSKVNLEVPMSMCGRYPICPHVYHSAVSCLLSITNFRNLEISYYYRQFFFFSPFKFCRRLTKWYVLRSYRSGSKI